MFLLLRLCERVCVCVCFLLLLCEVYMSCDGVSIWKIPDAVMYNNNNNF